MNQMQSPTGLFEQIAAAVSAKYLAQVRVMAARLGERPPFDELMGQLQRMEAELTREGVQYYENQKGVVEADNQAITNSLKEIIKRTIEDFVKQL